jgi:hypothetical protein
MKLPTQARKHVLGVILGVFILSTVVHVILPQPKPDLPSMSKDYPDVDYDNFLEVKFIETAQDLLNTGHKLNEFRAQRQPRPIDGTNDPFFNRDLITMTGLFNVSKRLTLTIPDTDSRYLSVMAINELGNKSLVYYGAGRFQFNSKAVGTHYALLIVNIYVDLNNPSDLKRVHALQNSIQVSPKSQTPYPSKTYDKEHFDLLWSKLNQPLDHPECFRLNSTEAENQSLNCRAIHFSSLPKKHLLIEKLRPKTTADQFKITLPANIKAAPFWSLSLYNRAGLFEKNAQDIYSFNSFNTQANPDNSVTLHLEACNLEGVINCLPSFPEWQTLLRIYEPTDEMRSGSWTLPDWVASPK